MTITKAWNVTKRVAAYYMKKAPSKNLLPRPRPFGHGHLDIVDRESGYMFRVYGGSFLSFPVNRDIYGVKLAPEIQKKHDLDFPIQDFSTPKIHDLVMKVETIIEAGIDHCEVYIGCMGGYGRTGTVISAVVMGATGCTAEEAVTLVRRYIHPHCVETEGQLGLLAQFEVLMKGRTIEQLADHYRRIGCN
ncbi:putative protein-tyrosine phosphatase [Vibrio phage V-YDF132]|nr:putative protein-tyrosine phosphatase [Vibrio phage V-YDF132]